MPPRKKMVPTTFDQHLANVVESKRSKANLTVEELGAMAGIRYQTLRRRLSGSPFTVNELERVAKAVKVPAGEIVEEALRDYGGIEKLLREYGPPEGPPMSGVRPNLKPLPPHGAVEGDEEDELLGDGEEYPSAANFDPEHDQDEPAHP